MLKLFYASGTCSLAAHIALEETGPVYEALRVDFATGEQTRPEYLEINPKGRVPALVTERGVLTETPAILSYIAQTFPRAGLAPQDDAFLFGQMQAFNVYLASTLHIAFAHVYRPTRFADGEAAAEAMRAKAPQVIDDAFALIEAQLAGDWVLGDRYSVADAYLYVFSRWFARDKLGHPQRFGRLAAHMRRIEAREAVQRVLAVEGLASMGPLA